ncbi:MAG: hypothetical protein M0R06_06905 [Sphaerochaeta sp.]|jgi:hypothetical protein|nr:hypothetical protein [Sphaerochaeta sp.]
MPEFVIPRNFDFGKIAWHKALMETKARFCAGVSHRRGWKTKVACAELVRRAYLTGRNVFYVSPAIQQSRRNVWDNPMMLQSMVLPEDWTNATSSPEMKIPINGGRNFIYVMGADSEIVGGDCAFVVIDEAQNVDLNEVWSRVFFPMLMASKGGAWIMGTYRGKDGFYSMVQNAIHSGDPDWFGWDVNVEQSGIFSPEEIETMRHNMPKSVFDEEFMNKPTATGMSVFKEPRSLVKPTAHDGTHRHRLGVDLAKRSDFTVITAIDTSLPTFAVLPQERFTGIDWSIQRGMIESAYHRYNKPKGFIDATGVGDPMAESIEQNCSGMLGYRFSAQSREALLNNLVMVLEEKRVTLPDDDGLISELESFRWVPNRKDASPTDSRVKFRAEAPAGCHDDRVMSLALACWELPLRREYYYGEDNRIERNRNSTRSEYAGT